MLRMQKNSRLPRLLVNRAIFADVTDYILPYYTGDFRREP